MIMDGESIPETYNEIIIELETSITNIDTTIEEKKKELGQIFASFKSFYDLKDIDIEKIIYDKTEEAVAKRVSYNNELKNIIKHIRIDFLNTVLEIEFANKITRLIDGDGSVLDYEKDHVPEDFTTIYNYDKGYINPDA